MSAVARRVAILGAPSNLGLKPSDDSGEARGVDRTPRVLRELGLADRLQARDLGDVIAPPYRDFVRPPGGTRNEAEIVAYSHALADAIRTNARDGELLLILGGDCSILLGTLLGCGPCGLVFLDGHCDFATPAISSTGGAAGMDLAFAVGRGGNRLARLGEPLIAEEHVAVLGRKDLADEPYYGADSMRHSAVLDLPWETIARRGVAAVASEALARVGNVGRGFVVHVDADILDPAVMPAVDSPEPGGMSLEILGELLAILTRHPRALALQLTVYDPRLDPDRECARRLVDCVNFSLRP